MPPTSPVNPRKKFPWTIEFEGLEPALAQKVKIPKISIDTAEHGAVNLMIKTGGKVKIDDLEVTKLMFADKNENWAYDWLKQVSNPETGVMGVPSQYKRNGYIIWYANDLITVLEKWQVFGCFPKEIEKDELDQTAVAENVMEKVIISVDSIVRA